MDRLKEVFIANFKATLPYIFGLVSLMIAFGIVSQSRLAKAEVAPTVVPLAVAHLKPEIFPGAAKLVRCQALSEPRSFFYVLSPTSEEGDQITISGTVYTAQLTPLADAVLEIWQYDPYRTGDPYLSPPRAYVRTDGEGRYKFAALKPTQPEQANIRYEVVYQDYCPLHLYLHLVTGSDGQPLKPDADTQAALTGPVLQGPVDLVLPVPPRFQ